MLALGWTWTCVRFTVSWKPQFDLGGHLGDVKSMIHTRNRSSQRKETDFPETSRQQQQHPTQTQPFVESARLQINRIGAGTPLLACVAQTRKHASFTRRGSHRRRAHALLTPFTLHMCACLSTRAQPLCVFTDVTETVCIIWVALITVSCQSPTLFSQIPSTGMCFCC